MKLRQWFPFLFLVIIAVVFFYKSVFLGRIPFPGDLLVAEYKPWRTYSYLGYNPGSYPHKAQYFDTLRQLYPWRTFSLSETQKKTIPLWNPHNFAGSPHAANSQSAVYYPFNIFYALLSQPAAWTVIMILGTFLSSLGTYLYVRAIGLSSKGSLLSAVAYGYSMFVTTFLEYNSIHHVILWLPFLLLAIEHLTRTMRPGWVLLYCISATSAAFGGHLQIFVYIMIFSGIYFLWKIRGYPKRVKPIHVLVYSLPFGLAAIQLIPTLELISHSARAPQEYRFLIDSLLIQPYQLALYFVADLFGNPATHNYRITDSYPGNSVYVGLVTFIFSILALKSWKNAYVRFFGKTAFVLLLLMTRSPITEQLYRIQIPFFSTASPTNAIFLVSFALSVLGGFGLDLWLTKNQKYTKRIVLAVGAAFVLFWLASRVDPSGISAKNLLFSTALYIATISLIIFGNLVSASRKFLAIGLIVIAVADGWYFFQKFNPFVPRELVFPPAEIINWLSKNAEYNRFWGVQNAAIEANIATQYALYSPDGYDPLYPKLYGEFLGLARNGHLTDKFTNRTRSDAVIPSEDNTILIDPVRKKVLDLLAVQYILDRTENANSENTFPPDTYKLTFEDNGWKIFKNTGSLPRSYLVNAYETYADAHEFESLFENFDPHNTVLLKQPFSLALDSTKSAGIATITAYTGTHVTIRTDAPSPQLLVLSDTYFPGWTATIDNKPTEIYRANWAMRAVIVPQGTHTVEFRYTPSSFSFGLKSTMMSLIITAGLCFSAWKKRYG